MPVDIADTLNAQNVALLALAKKGISRPPVVSTRFLADYGLTYTSMIFSPEHAKNVAGLIDIKNNSIVVNANDSPQQQNYTIAHELGHFLLKHNELPDFEIQYCVFMHNASAIEQNAMEQEANFFADNLLVPLHFLNFYLDHYPSLSDYQLAGVFGVPVELIKRRRLLI